jgi:hypothetical protein
MLRRLMPRMRWPLVTARRRKGNGVLRPPWCSSPTVAVLLFQAWVAPVRIHLRFIAMLKLLFKFDRQ